MPFIAITKGLFAEIDECDLLAVSRLKWQSQVGAYTTYAVHSFWDGKYHKLMLHHFILPPPEPGMMIDHRDGNGLNNKRSNLRVATKSQNNRNIHRFNGISKYRGVRPGRRSGTFEARININKKRFQIGTFRTELEAAIAYDEAAIKLHGEFARTNQQQFPCDFIPRG